MSLSSRLGVQMGPAGERKWPFLLSIRSSLTDQRTHSRPFTLLKFSGFGIISLQALGTSKDSSKVAKFSLSWSRKEPSFYFKTL